MTGTESTTVLDWVAGKRAIVVDGWLYFMASSDGLRPPGVRGNARLAEINLERFTLDMSDGWGDNVRSFGLDRVIEAHGDRAVVEPFEHANRNQDRFQTYRRPLHATVGNWTRRYPTRMGMLNDYLYADNTRFFYESELRCWLLQFYNEEAAPVVIPEDSRVEVVGRFLAYL